MWIGNKGVSRDFRGCLEQYASHLVAVALEDVLGQCFGSVVAHTGHCGSDPEPRVSGVSARCCAGVGLGLGLCVDLGLR